MSLAERRHVERPARVLAVLEQAGHGQHLEAPVGADEQFGRPDRRLDGAEPQAFGLARRAAKLAGRIDLDLDAAVGDLLQLVLVELHVLVLHVVDGQRRELHGDCLRVRQAGSPIVRSRWRRITRRKSSQNV